MSAAFTPGPWNVGEYGITSLTGDAVLHAVDGHVYDEYDSDSATIEIENEADARLIAAAPELYEALDAFVREYVQLVESGDAGFWNAEEEPKVIQARAALSKASGK